MAKCSVETCDLDSRSNGLCVKHFSRWRRTGRTESSRPDLEMSPMERFLAKVEKSAGCWVWVGARAPKGHGVFRVDGKNVPAHRWIWEQANGPVPEGLVMDHFACDTAFCVNPSHVRPVTIKENVLRGTGPSAVHARKVACKYGHPLSGDNLRVIVRKSRGGRIERVCRECERRRAQARRSRSGDSGT